VIKTLSDASLATHGPLRQDLERWLAKARAALLGSYMVRLEDVQEAAVPVLTQPTSRQREAFELIGAAIPLTLGK